MFCFLVYYMTSPSALPRFHAVQPHQPPLCGYTARGNHRQVPDVVDIAPGRNRSKYKSQHGQDVYVESLVSRLPLQGSPYFVEFGARDGIEHSNSFVFEKTHGWHGALIEPLRSDFNKLKHTRPLSSSFHGLVSSIPGQQEQFLEIAGVPSLRGWHGSAASLAESGRLSTIQKRVRATQGAKINADYVKSWTISHVLEVLVERKPNSIFVVLFIDCEGCEWGVLRAFTFNPAPLFIVVERSQDSAQACKLESLMHQQNYVNLDYRSSDVIYGHASLFFN